MHQEPPSELADLLSRLHLATAEQMEAAGRFARRMSGDWPLFDSLWLDALVRLRLLTPYQASEISAARGEQLLVGPYVLQRPIADLGYARSFCAIELGQKRGASIPSAAAAVNLVVRRCDCETTASEAAAKLQPLVATFAELKQTHTARMLAAGAAGPLLWATFEGADEIPVARSVACIGRLAPGAVLEIARQMAAALSTLGEAGIVHGDISAWSLWLNACGQIKLTNCGIRGIMESMVGNGARSNPLEMFDYLAPERLTIGAAPTTASDLYACGCLWWHLLAGRPPLLGGDVSGKTRAVLRPRIPDIRQIAPDVAHGLASAIEACTQAEASERPTSFAALAELLGCAGGTTQRKLAARLAASGHRVRRASGWKTRRRWQHAGQPIAAIAACVFLLAAATWPLWRPRRAVNLRGLNQTAVVQVKSGRETKGPPAPIQSITKNEPRNIRQVNYQSEAEGSPQHATVTAAVAETSVMELPCDSEINGAAIRLVNGGVVRGSGGKRPKIVTPPNGLIVAADRVRFENVDFIWRERAEEIVAPERHALVEIRGPHASFVGCTFQALTAGAFELPVAIRLSDHRGQRGAALAPAVRVQLEHCATQGVTCGIDCRTRGPAAIGLNDVLHLGQGPLIGLSLERPADAPVSISLEHVTARNMPAVLELDDGETADERAAITLTSTASVFAPKEGGSLILLVGSRTAGAVSSALKSLEWNGQSSLIGPNTAVAFWQHGSKQQPIPDADLAVDGLVSASFDFAAPAGAASKASCLQRWLAPQKSDRPPGISDEVPNFPSLVNRRD